MPEFGYLSSEALSVELGSVDSTLRFTTARRKQAVKDGEREFLHLTGCLVRTSTIACSNGVGRYNLLSTVNISGGDFLELAGRGPEFHLVSSNSSIVTYVAGDDFTRRDIEWLNVYESGWRATTGGTPRYYYLEPEGGQLFFGLWPPPEIDSTAGEVGRVVVPYTPYLSTDVSDTYVPFTVGSTYRTDLAPYHQGIVHFAAYQLEKLRKDTARSNVQLQMFQGYVARFLQMMRPKGGNTLRMARNYFRPQRGAAWQDDPFRSDWS